MKIRAIENLTPLSKPYMYVGEGGLPHLPEPHLPVRLQHGVQEEAGRLHHSLPSSRGIQRRSMEEG